MPRVQVRRLRPDVDHRRTTAANGGGANKRDRGGDFAHRRVSKSPVDLPTVASVDCSRSTDNARRQIRRTPLVAISTRAFHFDACWAHHSRRHRCRWVYGAVAVSLPSASKLQAPVGGPSVVAVNPIARVLCVGDLRSEQPGRRFSRFLQSAWISRVLSRHRLIATGRPERQFRLVFVSRWTTIPICVCRTRNFGYGRLLVRIP